MSSPAAVSCVACGEANPGHARFCLSCGAALAPAAQSREVRKTVTTLFCDVVESTSLGESTDPELVRRVMSRFFDEMRGVIERHGGTVEKFSGDEVMAVFGVPAVHEDDAVRAVRAAAEMRSRLRRLNADLEQSFGVTLMTRMGVNTGEVVAGDPTSGQTFVTGESVNLAKRLQQAARPGEILIGTATYPLVKDAVEVGPAQRFSVKGRSEPVAPRRLDAVDATAPGLARRFDAPLQGRDRELAALQEVLEDAVRAQSARRITLLGPAGIGKSRLAREFLDSVRERAEILTGRCLPYGEGITFWPLGQIVREAGGDRGLDTALSCEAEADLIKARIRGAIGLSADEGGTQETFWAVRRFFECLASRRPLVVCFEDIHWAEPTLLNLIEYLTTWSQGGPILILCLARPDLLETRTTWASPTPESTLVTLEPLASEHAEALLTWLQGEAGVGQDVRARIIEAADGNPLFVEQMAAVAKEDIDGAGPVRVPPSIQALLEERLDRLDPEERLVIEYAAVIGKEFWRDALLELLATLEPDLVESHLMSLVRKGLLRPDASARREEAFRFRHVLIRDAAYERLPKDVRAPLHESLANWLERVAPERAIELEEIVGYHLEQAHRYRTQLGTTDGAVAELALRAAARLGPAGRRAFARGDMPAAVRLLTRATLLLANDDHARLDLASDLASALVEIGEMEQAEGVLQRAAMDAKHSGDARLEARAKIGLSKLEMVRTAEGARGVRDVAESAIRTFEAENDELGLAQAWRHLARVHLISSRWAAQTEALEQALVHVRRAGDRREEVMILTELSRALHFGPTPVRQAIARCEAMLEEVGRDRTLEASVLVDIADLEAMRGRFDRARSLYSKSREILTELGLKPLLAVHTLVLASIEALAGRPGAAEAELRAGVVAVDELGVQSSWVTLTAVLARVLFDEDRLDEAQVLVDDVRASPSSDAPFAQVLWMTTQARLLAARGDLPEAERFSRDAARLAAQTDALNLHADALVDLAEVLASREPEEADRAIEEAIRLYALKGNEVAERRTSALKQAASLTRSGKSR
jgi:class 3 adenylate cyclase/tetratricopeptide (TPR) repeat protein